MIKKLDETVKNENISNNEWAKEIHKLLESEEDKIALIFYRQYLGPDLSDMQLISKFNKWFKFLLCVIGIYSKYAPVIPLKDKKEITITNTFQNISGESTTNQMKYM